MLFSSLLFLYVFLPLVLLLALLSPRSWHNVLLLVASLIFYAWGGVSYSVLLLGSIGINYAVGLGIGRAEGSASRKKRLLIIGLVINLLLLIVFKYTNFLLENLNLWLPPQQQIHFRPISLPLGISFFTFQAISYLVDVYSGRTLAQRKWSGLALYISFFPQLIAGPIVRYHDIAAQIRQRTMSWSGLASGIERFIVGLSKKVLLANSFALVADDIFAVAPQELDVLSAWTGLLLYSLQIYFDFSGYSDMAIGLGRMFGFQIPENFNFPYIARSIRQFWRRWHISLSQWFRDYLYIPLGGNRHGPCRTYFNLLLVFLLTGLWHGASWNFLLWGLAHGGFMMLERWKLDRFLAKMGSTFSHLYAILVILLTWVLFRAPNLPHAWAYYGALLGWNEPGEFRFDLAYYFGPQLWLLLLIGLLACTPFFQKINQHLQNRTKSGPILHGSLEIACSLGLMLLFLYCSMNLAADAYNPFIYFRF